MKRKRPLSKTPRSNAHSRKVEFSLLMREKFSENWMALRKEIGKTKKGAKKISRKIKKKK